jgi:hypothetical protein
MSFRLTRGTAVAGLLYVVLLVTNVAGTTDGPRPNAPAVREAARIAAHGTAIRWSALLGVLGALAFCAFTTGLALIVASTGRSVAAAAVAAAGAVAATVSLLSFSALAAAAQSAQRGAPATLTIGFGDLHSVTLLASFAVMGVVLAAAVGSGVVRSRAGRLATVVLAGAGLASAALVLDVRLDAGPFGAVVVLPFVGIPIWVAALSVAMLRGRVPVLTSVG